jgi:exportin-T
MTPQELEHMILLAADVSKPQSQWEATRLLTQWVNDSSDAGVSLIQLLKWTQQEAATFFALTSLQRMTLNPEERVELRALLLSHSSSSSSTQQHMQVKMGVVLAKLIQQDFVASWHTAFDELHRTASTTLYLWTLDALFEASYSEIDPATRGLKDALRGFPPSPSGGTTPTSTHLPVEQTISFQIMERLVTFLAQEEQPTLTLTVMKGMLSWVDLSLAVQEKVMMLLYRSLRQNQVEAPVLVLECFSELVGRGMDAPKKVALLEETKMLENIAMSVNLDTLDVSPTEVVIEVAKFVNLTGLELIPSWEGKVVKDYLWHQILDLFFRCFAYDDIDVSGAVIPLACRIGVSMDTTDSPSRSLLPQMLTVMYQQMKYPEDFQFDYEDEDEAEEEVYRTDLRKLSQRLVRAVPDMCLQFLCEALANLPVPLSTSVTRDAEAALRLVFHYCEGVRPSPGLKTVMKNTTFLSILAALHGSDITAHPHREVLLLYYDTAVRYATIFEKQTELLPHLLGALSGPRGIQHEHPRVRSRSCYLLLKLVKGLVKIMRPYVETAVTGIHQLLSNPAQYPLRPEDALYLFETIGILLGKTRLQEDQQQQSLTKVMTPHVHKIEELLGSSDLANDPEHYGAILAESVSAISYLSKGFHTPPETVQVVLVETLTITLAVFRALPTHEGVRKNCTGLWQRMTQCLGAKVLTYTPQFLELQIGNCTADDILVTAQMMNQCCIKFKQEAAPALDAALLPFLRKCHTLMPGAENGDIAPHLETERLSIKKLSYVVLQHVVTHRATVVLLSPRNSPNIEEVLKIMSGGALEVEEPVIKKTCIQFFRELIDQWGPQVNGANCFERSYIHYVYESFCPGMLKCFLSRSFDEKDAMQSRSINEFAQLLFSLKTTRGADEFTQCIIVGCLQKIGCPPNVMDAFRTASEAKQVELYLKETIKVLKRN